MKVTEKQLKAVHKLRVWYQGKMAELLKKQADLERKVGVRKTEKHLKDVREAIKEI